LARAIQRCRSTAIAANGGRIEASPASGVAIERWHSGSRLVASLQRSEVGLEGVVTARSLRGPSSTGEGHRAVKKRGGSEGGFGVTADAGRSDEARNGCSRVCPCVGSEVAEVVGRPSDPEKRSPALRVNIARRTVGRDGDLARSNLRESESGTVGAAGEEVARAGFVAETHVTASRNRKRLTRVRGCPPAVEGISGRTERLIFTEGRRKRPWQPEESRRATARRQWSGSDRGVRGTARSEAPGGSNAERQPEEARRSG